MSENPQISAIKALQGLGELRNWQMAQALGYKSRDGWSKTIMRTNDRTDLGFNRLSVLIRCGANPDFFHDNAERPLAIGITPKDFQKEVLKAIRNRRR